MTDLELAAKKIAEIETFVAELRTMSRPADVITDLRELHRPLQLGVGEVGVDRKLSAWLEARQRVVECEEMPA